jgi:hypothetical protein
VSIWQPAHRISRRTGQLSNRCAKMPACDWASVAELVDALDSKSSAVRRAGSIPAGGTTQSYQAVLSHIAAFVSTMKVENSLALLDPSSIIRSRQFVGTSDGIPPLMAGRYHHMRPRCHSATFLSSRRNKADLRRPETSIQIAAGFTCLSQPQGNIGG